MRSLPNTNINKFAAFVILAVGGSLGLAGCGFLSPDGAAQSGGPRAPYGPPEVAGKLESGELKEASGIAASKCQPDVYWTHNDSGDEAFLFAINSKGEHLGVWKIAGAANRDWEDIAAIKAADGKCHLLIGDIGNNELERDALTIYTVEEPAADERTSQSSAKDPLAAGPAALSSVKYPNERHNAEALLSHPSGELYILTKSKSDPSHIYKFRPRFEGETQTMAKVADIIVPAIPNGSITGGDISPDGKRVVLCDYFAGYELELPASATGFDDVWKQKPLRIDLGQREVGEAVAYSTDGSFVIAVSEKKKTPVNITRRLPSR